MKKIRYFSTFTGVGSFEMALRNKKIPFKMIGISEVDKHALNAYDAIHCQNIDEPDYPTKDMMLKEFNSKNIGYNFSTGESEIPKNDGQIKQLYRSHIRTKNYGDIRLIDENKIPDFDLFTYSFPCKNISVAGQQAGLEEGSGTQSSLLWECRRIIEAKKPAYLIMENVKNLVSDKHRPLLNLWITTLRELGYKSFYEVLNGKDFGVPQNRERIMMISVLEDDIDYVFPKTRELNYQLHDILEKEVDEKYFYKEERYNHIDIDLPSQEISYCLDAHYYKGISVDNYIKKRKRQLVQIGNLDKKEHANTRIYSSDGISPTLNSMNGGNRQPKILNNRRIRKLTPLECWRLMGYDDQDFYSAKNIGKLPESRLYERAGRGIIVPMLEDLFYNLFIVRPKPIQPTLF